MENLSNELNKLKIDKSKRVQPAARRGVTLVVLIVILVGGVVTARMLSRRSTAAATVEVVRPREERSSQSAVLMATGYVIAHHKVQVGSKIAGRVSWIGVEKGDRVKRDQMVVHLEDREFRAQYDQAKSAYDGAQAHMQELERGSRPEEIDRAKADVERAQADVQTADAQLKRIQGLVKEGVAPAQSLDDAKGRSDSARANVAALTKTYELIRQGPRQEQIDTARSEAARAKAAMEYAKTILDATEIRVPSNGTILERNVEQGEMVTTSFVGDRGAKSFVVTLADLDDLQVELDINQNDFNRISADQACTVVTDAYPDRVYNCRVDEISPEANRQKATIQVKVKVAEPDEYIRPDMNARVTFLEPASASKTSRQDESLYVIPKRAVLQRESGKTVYVVVDEKVQAKPIVVQKEVGGDVFVSAGLVGNEAIIVGEQLSQLKIGDRVQVK
ncbi:MAG TPA: efflux RND transporter periplasmic adaptor subunit [Terriglobia bacterium]|nr:efflux RND transporter periplasmic adaptor subunit [Terriglobia bacterium]